MPTLENCPCCGGEGKLKDIRGGKIRQGWVGCPACGIYKHWKISPAEAIRIWNTRARPAVETNLYDREELYPDCTVQVLTNTVTGETSVGWWENGKEARA